MDNFTTLELYQIHYALQAFEGAKSRAYIYRNYQDSRREESIASLAAYNSAIQKIKEEIYKRQESWDNK